MKDLHNIEKLKGRPDYTGYAAGAVWSIRKVNCSDGAWVAIPNNRTAASPFPWRVAAFTLADMSAKLERIHNDAFATA